MDFKRYPAWAQPIQNHYWYLRYARRVTRAGRARTRREYRAIEKAKKRLHEAGIEVELVRLLCRHMVNLKNRKAEKLFWKRLAQTMQKLP